MGGTDDTWRFGCRAGNLCHRRKSEGSRDGTGSDFSAARAADGARKARASGKHRGAARNRLFRRGKACGVWRVAATLREVEPTHEEWLAAIEFLTRTGQMCTDWRQEFILLSNALGVSMLVDAINHRRPSGATENTILGPFYLPKAPRYERGTNICLDGNGEPLVVGGFVRDTKGNPIEGALNDMTTNSVMNVRLELWVRTVSFATGVV
ncbi:hypothetical protein I6F11_07285 [Ensifer sp. NBAIM29]|nr:hypothetical protein [Ensifer sp. NBAIM29]